MLLECPECSLQVSDKAMTCPHCGYPIDPNNTKRSKRPSKRRMRLPNGFGQICEIKGRNLRAPFRVRVCVGKDDQGRYLTKLLKPQGYFKTYNEAYKALVEYNKNPFEIDTDIKMKDLYKEWSEYYFKTLKNPSSARTITSCWSYCSSIYNMKAKDLRAYHIRGCMDEGTIIDRYGKVKKASASTKFKIKSMFNMMLDYANERDIVVKNYARAFNIGDDILDEIEADKVHHISLTDDELELLWSKVDVIPYVDTLLFQCYSGWRPQEIGLIKLENINFDEWYMIGGMKTSAGKNRKVPIHKKIRGLVKNAYNKAVNYNSEYLFNCYDSTSGLKMTYDKYAYRFNNIIKLLKMNPEHRPHDPRKTFVTLAKRYNVDEYAIKMMVGHEISDITEKIYTDRDPEWLSREIAKIK